MAALAIRSEIEPRCLVLESFLVKVLLLLAVMAREAALVPDLDHDLVGFIRIADIEIVEPLFALDIPTRRKHHNAAVGKRCQIVLDAAVAESVIDVMFLRFSRKGMLDDEVIAPAFA